MNPISSPDVALIVVNWNGRAYLEACLSSLLASRYPNFSVIVVDNASTDGSPDLVRESFPQVQLIASPHNLGYGGGANLALRACEAQLAVILNSDITVPPDWLANLVAPLAEDPTIGVAGCKMYYPDSRIIQHAGGYITEPQGWPGHYGLNEEDRGQHDVLRDTDYVIGAAMALRRDLLERIGAFDEGYFLYYEDVDICLRARRAGYRVAYIPDAWLIHHESATTVKGSASYLERFYTGRWRFILKHYALDRILDDAIPAEEAWLSLCSEAERRASTVAYNRTLERLPEICEARARDGGQAIPAEGQSALAAQFRHLAELSQQAVETPPDITVRLEMEHTTPESAPRLQELATRSRLREQPFSSHVPLVGPLIAAFRAAWNSVSTKWYARPLIQQQSEFNELVVDQLVTLTARLQNYEALVSQVTDMIARLHDHEAWLIAQDHEQADLIRDLAELRLRLIQLIQWAGPLQETAGGRAPHTDIAPEAQDA